MSDEQKILWLQRPNRDSMSEWYNEVTWCEDKQNDDDTCYIKAGVATTELADEIESLRAERDRLILAIADHVTHRNELREQLAACEKERDSLLKMCNAMLKQQVVLEIKE